LLWGEALKGKLHSEEYVRMRLDNFVDKVDNKIQNQLMTDLMTKYSEISRHFEEQNRLLAKSEASLREAEQIALQNCQAFQEIHDTQIRTDF